MAEAPKQDGPAPGAQSTASAGAGAGAGAAPKAPPPKQNPAFRMMGTLRANPVWTHTDINQACQISDGDCPPAIG